MTTETVKKEQLYLGIDGGGTKCRAVIVSSERGLLGSGLAGPANAFYGVEKTITAIMDSTRLAIADAGLSEDIIPHLIAGIGLAGVNLAGVKAEVESWPHPFVDMHVTTDLQAACIGAHEGSDGAVIIIGTGSCGYSLVNGKEICLGGYGFPQGDNGSGAWMGLEVIKYVLLALDGMVPATLMTKQVLAQLECQNALELVVATAGKPSSHFARLARIVFECANLGDEAATRILKEGADYISKLARKLNENQPPRMSLMGGISEPLFSWLDDDVQQLISPLLAPPEIGAILFAKAQQHPKPLARSMA